MCHTGGFRADMMNLNLMSDFKIKYDCDLKENSSDSIENSNYV